MNPIGFSPSDFALSSDISSTADAPSVSGDVVGLETYGGDVPGLEDVRRICAPLPRSYEAMVGESRSITAEVASPDAACRHPDTAHWSLRWILLHMIEEYARHNGHADLLRERMDGSTGE